MLIDLCDECFSRTAYTWLDKCGAMLTGGSYGLNVVVTVVIGVVGVE